MPRIGVTVYDMLLSCPGDVLDMKDTIDACVKSFNASIGEANNIRVELKHWSTDSFSQSGDKPQNILNKQFIDECDLCVALLGIRFGTPTDNYDSGTEEEIEKMLEQNKQVFLYFVERSVDPSKIDMEQYKKVKDFKDKYADRGMYTVVKSEAELRMEFQNALSLYFIKLVAPQAAQLPITLAPELVISSADTGEQSLMPFHTNYQEVRLVQDKEDAIKELIKTIADIKITLSGEAFEDKTESEISDEALQNMTMNEIIQATDMRKITTEQFYKMMGAKAPVKEKVEFSEWQLNLLSGFCEQQDILLESDFYFLGNLQKETTFPLVTTFGKSAIKYLGSESEQEKYQLLKELFIKIEEYNHVKEFFCSIDAMPCISLMIENRGNTYDEDIDIKLFIEKSCVVDRENMPEPGSLFLEEAVKWKIPRFCFAGNDDADIEDFSSYPIVQYIPRNYIFPFKSREEELKEQKEEYWDIVNNIFCYELKQTDNEDILCLNIPYLKQNTKMFFPSYLFFRKEPSNIRYEIRSKHSPEVYKGTLKIKREDIN